MGKDENAVVLDVRTQEEVDEGVIPNAQHLDIYDSAGFMQGVQEMDKSKSYYVAKDDIIGYSVTCVFILVIII